MRDPQFDSAGQEGERPSAQPLPWGVHLAAGWSRQKALDQYQRIRQRHTDTLSGEEPIVVRLTNHSMGTAERYLVRIGQPSRDQAESLCARLKDAGGACVVYRTWHQ